MEIEELLLGIYKTCPSTLYCLGIRQIRLTAKVLTPSDWGLFKVNKPYVTGFDLQLVNHNMLQFII